MIKLVGIQKLDFTTKEGSQIRGTKIHYIYEPTGQRAENHIGEAVDTHFFSSNVNYELPKLVPGEIYDFITEYDGRKAVVVGLKHVQPAVATATASK